MQLTPLQRLFVIAALAIALAPGCLASGDESSPFEVAPVISPQNGKPAIVVSFHLPPRHRLYADALSFEIDGAPVNVELPEPVSVPDKHSGQPKKVFLTNFVASLPRVGGETSLAINLHGCNEEECYFPETRRWLIRANDTIVAADSQFVADGPKTNLTAGFAIAARTSGFQGSQKFLQFLSMANGQGAADNAFAGTSALAAVGLILLGGLALNLTPCVLPMIPINLAILGAGARTENKRRGFLLGLAYGGGMTLAYGLLGIIVVLTGSKFGTLNASPWFNFAIAAIFIVLGLAMLDRFTIDFSRFQRMGNRTNAARWAWLGAASMGAVSALLAGACVAPVVISVLLLAATFHQQGNVLGLLLPLLLGLGMALPWPFAAAGLSFLPKPGAWMVRVKHVFAVLIFGFAIWYGSLGWSLMRPLRALARGNDATTEKSLHTLESALSQSRLTGRPVLIDFWASWCKNCSAMENATLHEPSVRRRLNDFIVVKFQAEHLNDASIKPVLDEFGVMGLPTFVVLKPKEQQPLTAR